MQGIEMDSEECAVCSGKALHRCGKCRRAAYCSPAHQALVWPLHKLICGKDLDFFPQLEWTRRENDTFERTAPLSRHERELWGESVGPDESVTMQQVLVRSSRDVAEGLQLLWNHRSQSLAGLEPSRRSSAVASLRSQLVNFGWPSSGLDPLNVFIHIALLEEKLRTFEPDIPAATLLPLLRQAFDYYTLEFVAKQPPPLPTGFNSSLLEAAYAKLGRIATTLAEERGGTFGDAVCTAIVLVGVGHQSTMRRTLGMSAVEIARIYVQENARVQANIQASGRHVYNFDE